MGTHLPYLICHPAEVTFPPLPQPIKAGTRFSDPEWMQGWVDRSMSWLPARWSRPDRNILRSQMLLRKNSEVWKNCFYSVFLQTVQATCTLDRYRTLIGNRIQRIESFHLLVSTATGNARNRVTNLSNSVPGIASNCSHVALPQHLMSFS